MEVFVARQPIYDKDLNVFAYEILYRDGFKNYYNAGDGDKATSMVVMNSFLSIGFDTLTDNKKAFINFTKKLIDEEVYTLFPNNSIVIEILEDIEIDDEFINSCKKIKEYGYILALDDFIISDFKKYLKILDYIDIMKVDFKLNSLHEIKEIGRILKNKEIVLLAEKVETEEEFREALNSGYSLFQGYFFSRPVTLSGKDVSSYKMNSLQILKALNDDEPEFESIAQIVERDVSLSYNLLKLINSGVFFTGNKITSIKHALVMLGFKEIRKWISLILLRDMNEDIPEEIMKTCLVRGKLAELLTINFNMSNRKSEGFLMGLFSLIDIIMGRPLKEIINELPLNDDVKGSLLGKKNEFRDIYEIILGYEKADWDNIIFLCDGKINYKDIPDLYIEALDWSNKIINM